MKRAALAVSLLLVTVACSSDDDDATTTTTTTTTAADGAEALRLNDLQVLGSHNSYHLAPVDEVLAGVAAFDPDLAQGLDYTHRPLTEQLDDFGIRQFELDVYADPDGGRFADRPALSIVGLPTASGDPTLDGPGAKVFHVPDIDFRSTCTTFVACLDELEAWSSAHPDHLPITVLVEAKSETLGDVAGASGVDISGLPFTPTETLPWTREAFDGLEAEILSVLDRDRIITPDEVRGDHGTLEEAVLGGDAWPTVDGARGRFLFALVDLGDTRDAYVGDATSLEGRPDAAFLRIDDSLAELDRLRAAVEAGYLVRTRADVPEPPAAHAANGDTSLRGSAIASGAQYVSTDFYVEDPELGTGYVVTMPDTGAEGAVRCNPVRAPASCDLGGG